jgi:hypothetical protein
MSLSCASAVRMATILVSVAYGCISREGTVYGQSFRSSYLRVLVKCARKSIGGGNIDGAAAIAEGTARQNFG